MFEQREKPPHLGSSLEELEQEFEDRCRRTSKLSARIRAGIRDSVLRDAGAITYDQIEHEFRKIAGPLGWPRAATLKDFRHLFSTSMQNGGMPEFYRRYLMGQSPGRAAIVSYTHLNELRERYEEAVQRKFKPLVEVTIRRMREV